DSSACGWRDMGRDEILVRELLKWAQLNTCADMTKVFATGFSNGGQFTNYLACHASELFLAFAPISGDNPLDFCEPKRSISYVSMCGTEDDEAFCQPTFMSSAESWSFRSKCQNAGLPSATKFNFSATTSCFMWESCEAGNFVEVCSTRGLGHDASGHLRPDDTSYLRPGSDLDIVGYIFQKFSLLVDGSILFMGHPTREELAYKESAWPPPEHHDHIYIRN
ncbi:ESTA, partial [Symbiodinium pilosum]